MDLQARVDKLERNCRRLTALLLAMVSIAIAAALVNANQSTTQPAIRTESLEIVDSNGRVRARLGKADSDSFGLSIQTADGRPRLSVAAGDRGGAINLAPGGHSTGAVTLTALQDSAGLSLRGPSGLLRAQMLIEGDHVRLGLWNTDGKAVFAVPSSGVSSN